MNSFFQSPLGFYITTAVLNLLLTCAVYLIHQLTKKAEQKANSLLPPDEAQMVSNILDVVDKLTESAVQNANSQFVIPLKQQNLFTQNVADSLKKSVTNEILANMGNLKNRTENSMGSWENIIGNLIEKHVTLAKK